MLRFTKLVIAIYLIACTTWKTSAAGDICTENLMISTWNFSRSPPPTNLTSSLNESKKSIEVRSSQIKEDFCLSLFAIPRDNRDTSECPRVLEEKLNVRKFSTSYASSKHRDKHDNNTLSISYSKIFYGCYYFVMSSTTTDETWQLEPKLYKTNYPLVDSKPLIVGRNDSIIGGNSNVTRRMFVRLRVPLDCLTVSVRLWELKANIAQDDAMEAIKNGTIEPSQEYTFNVVLPEKNRFDTKGLGVSKLITKLESKVVILNDTTDSESKSFDGYLARVEWTGLESKPATYYSDFEGNPSTTLCRQTHTFDDLYRWTPVNPHNYIQIGLYNDSDTLSVPPKSDWNFPSTETAIGVLFVILALVLAYWSVKYSRIRRLMFVGPTDLPDRVTESAFVSDRKNSDRIMLIYAPDSPPFMEKMNEFREDLKKALCFEVYDMFDPKEWGGLAHHTPNGWVEKLLYSGSQVVWVDTPKFRSYVNDPRNEELDFRGSAISYAVSSAKELAANSPTQYLHHFVVRVEGFKVTDEYDDPLLVISPYTRYHIPQHFDQLLKDLTSPMVRIEIGKNEE